MHIKTEYLGDLRTQATHLSSNNTLITDAPLDNQGKGQAFSPTDLVAASLSACMLTIMGIQAQKHGYSLGHITTEVTKVMRSDPRKIAAIKIIFSWRDCELSLQERNHLKESALTCPVALSLDPNIRQEITFDF
ncbi:MAG: OsmC family protein [Cyclobacteriaceae bacterium]|nr:OsmC family protein [Cyclobacteriaceae bacterium HetDA_MAG_MS6]